MNPNEIVVNNPNHNFWKDFFPNQQDLNKSYEEDEENLRTQPKNYLLKFGVILIAIGINGFWSKKYGFKKGDNKGNNNGNSISRWTRVANRVTILPLACIMVPVVIFGNKLFRKKDNLEKY